MAIHHNIFHADVAITIREAKRLDASYNFWGPVEKEEIEKMINRDIDIEPWLITQDTMHDSDADDDEYSDAGLGGRGCNDADPNVYPGAKEICNSLDDNCNKIVDEGCEGKIVKDDRRGDYEYDPKKGNEIYDPRKDDDPDIPIPPGVILIIALIFLLLFIILFGTLQKALSD